jgi:hypothetical protein
MATKTMNPTDNHIKPNSPMVSGESALVKSTTAVASPGCVIGHIVDSPFLWKSPSHSIEKCWKIEAVPEKKYP